MKTLHTLHCLWLVCFFCLVGSAAHAQNAAPTHPVNGQFIKEWLVLGPFFPNDLETDFLAKVGGESNLNPKEGDALTTADGKTLTWKRYSSKTDAVDFINAVGYYENAIAYATCAITSPNPQTVEALLRSNDFVKVWLNDQPIHANLKTYGAESSSFPVSLKAGINHCLLKVSQVDSGWSWNFKMRLLPKKRALISGLITDERGVPIPNVYVRLEQNESEIMRTGTDADGKYRMGVYPVSGKYDLEAQADEKGIWQLGLSLREGEHRTLNLTLKKAISISGAVLALDDTPHVAIPVQAVIPHQDDPTREPKVIAGILSDEWGRYVFANLKAGRYQVRCHTNKGYIYYEKENGENYPSSLRVESGKTLSNIDFHFAPFKKGAWRHFNPQSTGVVHGTAERESRVGDEWAVPENGLECRRGWQSAV